VAGAGLEDLVHSPGYQLHHVGAGLLRPSTYRTVG
jgi:hypothetical protein